MNEPLYASDDGDARWHDDARDDDDVHCDERVCDDDDAHHDVYVLHDVHDANGVRVHVCDDVPIYLKFFFLYKIDILAPRSLTTIIVLILPLCAHARDHGDGCDHVYDDDPN